MLGKSTFNYIDITHNPTRYVMKIKVLNIDDNQDDRYFFKKALKASGMEATLVVAEDESAAWSAIEKEHPDCIFLDYHLPGTSGLEILKKLQVKGLKIPVIMLTGQEDKEIVVKLMKAGATDYIPKNSLTPELVRMSLDSAMRLYISQREKEQAQELLRINEARLEEAQRIALIGNWEFERESQVVFLSKGNVSLNT